MSTPCVLLGTSLFFYNIFFADKKIIIIIIKAFYPQPFFFSLSGYIMNFHYLTHEINSLKYLNELTFKLSTASNYKIIFPKSLVVSPTPCSTTIFSVFLFNESNTV